MARERESEGMAKYFRALRNEGMLSDSMVCKCLILTKQTYVLEQIVTIEVTPADERGNWHAAVWLDNGKDLSQSVQGPWSPLPGTKAWETYFYPVVFTKETGLSTSFSSHKTPWVHHPNGSDPRIQFSLDTGPKKTAKPHRMLVIFHPPMVLISTKRSPVKMHYTL